MSKNPVIQLGKNKAFVIVDMQAQFLEGMPTKRVERLIKAIEREAHEHHKDGYEVIPVQFGKQPTIDRLTFPFSAKAVKKQSMGGGAEIIRAYPGINHVVICGVYTDQCVYETAKQLLERDVTVRYRRDLCMPCISVSTDYMERKKIKQVNQQVFEMIQQIRSIPVNFCSWEK